MNTSKIFLLIVFAFFYTITLFAQGTCLSCKGSGYCTVRKRVQVSETKTYEYGYTGSGANDYRVSSSKGYGSRYFRETCYACGGSGIKRVVVNSKPAPPRLKFKPNPTFKQKIEKRFGRIIGGSENIKIQGRDFVALHYDGKDGYDYTFLERTGANDYRVVIDDDVKIEWDENNEFMYFKTYENVFTKNGPTQTKFYDINGRLVFIKPGMAYMINKAEDMWISVETPEEKKTRRDYRLINNQTGKQLLPGTYKLSDFELKSSEIWTAHGLIDAGVQLKNSNKIRVGVFNKTGEAIIPPIYKGIYKSSNYYGTFTMYDDEGYLYTHNLNGDLLLPEGEEINCKNGVIARKVQVKKLSELPSHKKRLIRVESLDKFSLMAEDHPNINGLELDGFSCSEDGEVMKVVFPGLDDTYKLHQNGMLTKATSQFDRSNLVDQSVFTGVRQRAYLNRSWEPSEKRGKKGGKFAGGDYYEWGGDEFVIKKKYKQVFPVSNKFIFVQDFSDKWGLFVAIDDKHEVELKPVFDYLFFAHDEKRIFGIKDGEVSEVIYKYYENKISISPLSAKADSEAWNFVQLAKRFPISDLSVSNKFSELNISATDIETFQRNSSLDFIKLKNGRSFLKVDSDQSKIGSLIELPKSVQAVTIPISSSYRWFYHVPVQDKNGKWRILQVTLFNGLDVSILPAPYIFDEVNFIQNRNKLSPYFINKKGIFKLDLLEKEEMRALYKQGLFCMIKVY